MIARLFVNRIRSGSEWGLLAMAIATAALLLFAMAGMARAEDPSTDATPVPVVTALPVPTVAQEYKTYNIFNFPKVSDVLDIVLKGLSDAMRQVTQPTFATLNLILKTPTLASDGESGADQLNFYAIVEPLWRLATLPMAGLIGFVLLLYSGIGMQLSAANRSTRGIGASMEGLAATLGGITLAVFSLQAFHLANEADNVLVDLIMQAPGPGQGMNLSLMAGSVLSSAGIAGPLAAIIVGIILLIPTLLLLMMAVARWALFFIVAVLSPLAAVSIGSAPTRRLTSLWSQMFLFVMLLGPANAILLRSIQGLYDISLGSLGHLEAAPRAVASGAVMFGLLSMAGVLNYTAVQRAFGAALGWASTAVKVAVGGLALAGAAAGAVVGGGGLSALGSSLSGASGLGSAAQGTGGAIAQASTLSGLGMGAQGLGGATGSKVSATAISQNPSGPVQTGKSSDAQDDAGDTPEGWSQGYRARRREGFDWNRATLVGGSIASMAPGPAGRLGMAARLLGMSGMVEERFGRGVAERDEARQETRERAARADLAQQRSLIFGRPMGPDQVERANAVDRAVANVGQRTSDHEGLRTGLVDLGRSALGHSVISGDAYDGISHMSKNQEGSERSRIENITGLYLESELLSRGTLRGEPVYAVGEAGMAQVNLLAAEGIGRSLGLHDGANWQAATSGESEQLRDQALGLVGRLRAIGELPRGRSQAEEIGKDIHLAGTDEALSQLEAYVKQIEGSHSSQKQIGQES